MEIASLVLLGTCVGTFGTMIGLGGGLILVPLFMFTMLAPNGTTFEVVQQVIGTSLFAVACNSVSGAYAYLRQKRIMFRAAIPFLRCFRYALGRIGLLYVLEIQLQARHGFG